VLVEAEPSHDEHEPRGELAATVRSAAAESSAVVAPELIEREGVASIAASSSPLSRRATRTMRALKVERNAAHATTSCDRESRDDRSRDSGAGMAPGMVAGRRRRLDCVRSISIGWAGAGGRQ
jgi:hypothetical protein